MSSSETSFSEECVLNVQPWVAGKLFSFRISRPKGYRFVAGQFARLGIRLNDDSQTMVWRAYSMVSPPHADFLEFYSIVVPDGQFTSRLTHLRPGDRLLIDKNAHGFLTTAQFTPAQHLLLVATGTGIAPFLSILQDLSIWEEYPEVTLLHGVRQANELAYQETILSLADQPYYNELITPKERLKYAYTVTQDSGHNSPYCIATSRLTTLIAEQRLESLLGRTLDPQKCRIMLCGNPSMLKETRQLLKPLGFKTTRREAPGNLALENYW